MKKYLPSITILLAAILFQFVPYAFASYIGTSLPSLSVSAPGTDCQLLYNNNGTLGAIPNTCVLFVNGAWQLNQGDSSNFPHMSGGLNVYNTAISDPILSSSFMGNTPSYLQTFLQNLNPGGSSDVVLANDKGTATSTENYIDYGIANSQQFDPTLPIIQAYDGYLFNKTSRLILGSGAGINASSTVVISAQMSTTTYTRFDQYGHMITHGKKPVLTGAAGCTLSATSNDQSGTITCSGLLTLTNLTLTFSAAYQATEVQCSLNNKNNATLGGYTSTLSTLTLPTTIALGGGSYTYQCQATE